MTVWLLSFSSGLDIQDCRGGRISYSGVMFEGSPRDVFWTFLQPCLDDIVEETLEKAEEQSRDYGPQVASQGLEETRDLLKFFVTRVYARTVEIDRGLRGRGYPEKVDPHNAQSLVDEMHRKIDEHSDAIIAQVHMPSWFERRSDWMNRHHVVMWVVFGVVITLVD